MHCGAICCYGTLFAGSLRLASGPRACSVRRQLPGCLEVQPLGPADRITSSTAAWASTYVGIAACLAVFRISRCGTQTALPWCASSGGTIETFLVQGEVDAARLSASCAPLAACFDLSCLAFFALKVPPETIASVAGGALGIHGVCPVFIADCYGIIGWDAVAAANIELMEEGRGKEYGGIGGKGGKGVVVVAFRGNAHVPVTASEGSLPASCGAHMVVTAAGLPSAAPTAGVVYGGVAKACYKLERSGDLVSVPQFAVSTSHAVISSFADDAGQAASAALKAMRKEPKVGGYFPCFMRGINQYGKDGVEPSAFAERGLNVRLFGMFAHGELGPPKGCPIVCGLETPAVTAELHSMTSVLALYGA